MNSHLTPRDLLLYVDGELPLWRIYQARTHLLSCWKCRRDLERLEQDISAIVDAQSQSFLPSTPPPARPWDNFEALAATLPLSRFSLGTWLRQTGNLLSGNFSPSLRWATAMATLFCVLVTTLWLIPERLSAEIVMHRMEKAELARVSSDVGHVIRQRLHVERIDRGNSARRSIEVESWKAGTHSVWRGDVRDLEERYRRAGLVSSLPVSPVAGEHWLRETGVEPRVLRVGDGIELEARSVREGNDVESVTVRVQRGTWRLQALRLTFTDSIFDIAVVELTTVNKGELPLGLTAELDPASALSTRSVCVHPNLRAAPPVTASSGNFLEDELRVQYSLHQIGADLSEPIELKQDHGTVVINARGASDERKRQLAGLFGGEPRIRLETEVNSTALNSRIPVTVVPASPSTDRNPDKQLIQFFGTSDAQENFTRAVLNADASILSRLYALRSLAQHWPSGAETSLSSEGREELQAMVSDHLRALRATQPELKQLLDPLLDRLCGSDATMLDASAAQTDWRQSVQVGLVAARTLDQNLRALLTTSASGKSLVETCPLLRSSLRSLSSSVANTAPKY